MREAGQFRSLSFRVFTLRGSQPGKKKKLRRRRRVERREFRNPHKAKREKGGDKHLGEIRASEVEKENKKKKKREKERKREKDREENAKRGFFVFPHPIDLHLVLA